MVDWRTEEGGRELLSSRQFSCCADLEGLTTVGCRNAVEATLGEIHSELAML